MKSFVPPAILGLIACCPMLSAATITANIGGAATGAFYLNFDDLDLGATPTAGSTTFGPSGSAKVTISPDGGVVQGSMSGLYAAPFISNSNGLPFADSTVAGQDSTKYLSTGKLGAGGSVDIDFGATAALKYFGLLWGSVDAYNTLAFYNGATLVESITGSDVTAGANGNQGVNGTYYVNINTDFVFNRVIATSSEYAFEFDNVSYSTVPAEDGGQPVPDSGMTLALLGMSLGGLAWVRRKVS